MRYYKQMSDDGTLLAIGTGGTGGEDITEDEYNSMLSDIHRKCEYVDAVYADPDAISTVPEEWREEILQRVEERKEQDELAKNELTDSEALSIITGGMSNEAQ